MKPRSAQPSTPPPVASSPGTSRAGRAARAARATLPMLLTALALAGAPQSAHAGQRGKTKKAPATARKTTKKAAKAGRTAKAAARSGASHSAVLTWVRAEIARAAKTGRPSDLASLLLSGALEAGFAQTLYSHYALAGLGNALHKGAMPAEHVAGMAEDMANNLGHSARTFTALGKTKALARIGAAFAGFARLAEQGATTATALASWARGKGTPAAFDAALERYRTAVQGLAQQVRGQP